jgi:hypothetical protein
LIPLADALAELAMESEARLAMIDGGLPIPMLQYEIIDGNRELGRVRHPARAVLAGGEPRRTRATAPRDR